MICRDLKHSVTSHEEENGKLQACVDKLNQRLSAAISEKAALSKQLSKWNTEKASLQTKLSTIWERNAELREEIE